MLNNEKLNELMLSEDFSIGGIYTKRKLENFISTIESKYLQTGFFNINIE